MANRRPRRSPTLLKLATTHIVISYVPLLRGEAGEAIDPARAVHLVAPILETNAGHVQAVAWARDESGAPWPVLVLDRAEEVFEHLVEWTEGSPATCFKLVWATRGGSYALALMPRFERSVERYKIAHRLLSGADVPVDASFKFVFAPLLFHGPLSAISREQLPRLPARVRIGFLPRSELPTDLSDINQSEVRFCGPIDVERDQTGYLRRILR